MTGIKSDTSARVTAAIDARAKSDTPARVTAAIGFRVMSDPCANSVANTKEQS